MATLLRWRREERRETFVMIDQAVDGATQVVTPLRVEDQFLKPERGSVLLVDTQ